MHFPWHLLYAKHLIKINNFGAKKLPCTKEWVNTEPSPLGDTQQRLPGLAVGACGLCPQVALGRPQEDGGFQLQDLCQEDNRLLQALIKHV